MKWSVRYLVVLCAISLVLPASSLAAGKRGGGGGYGGGGGQSDEGILYGDLYVMLRDDNGEPILDANGCIQPVYIEEVEGVDVCQSIDMWDPIESECALPDAALDLVISVETGRLSASRTTDSVLDHAYTEAVKNIQYAVAITVDPAFRLLLTFNIYDEDGNVTGEERKTIDSPLENLAMYKKLMANGFFPSITTVPMSPEDEAITYDPCLLGVGGIFARDFHWLCDDELNIEDLQSAVSFIAAAADKGGGVYLDMLININSNLSLNGPDVLAPDYFPFTDHNIGPLRHRYAGKDPVELLTGPYDDQDDGLACLGEGETWFMIEMVDIFQDVPFKDVLSCKPGDIGVGGPSGPSGAADNFVQAADDARAVIEFLHNWSIPEYPVDE